MRSPLAKQFRHHGKIITAAVGDFDRPVMPYVIRATKAVLQAAMAQISERIEPTPEPVSYEAELAAIYSSFGHQIAYARKHLPPSERAAAVRALKWQRHIALQAIRERRATTRHSDHIERQRRRKPPEPTT